jgi:hypothetical protein
VAQRSEVQARDDIVSTDYNIAIGGSGDRSGDVT